jgi:hypothetical protein
MGAIQSGGIADGCPFTGITIENIPRAEETERIIVLAVLEGTLGLVPVIFVGDEGIDMRKQGGLVDLDFSLVDFDLAVQDL